MSVSASTRAEKPPYRVPTMQEVRETPLNGKIVASLFSGCGGSSLGYRMAGYRVAYANEFVEAARDSYKANAAPYTVVDGRDVRTVKPEDLMDAAGVKPGQLDLLDGSPPCASFSTSGRREEGWGKEKKYSDTKQRTDDLFFEFSRILEGVRPKVFVAENVSGLVKGVAVGYFNQILAELKDCGYDVAVRQLDAQWLGVPQVRGRVIFVGVRKDLGLKPAHPKPFPYRYSVADALPHLARCYIQSGEAHHINKPGWSFPRGEKRGTHLPAPTVQASPRGMGSAPSKLVLEDGSTRDVTIDECKALQSFPPDFVLTGTYEKQWERIGRSVPPLMMRAIARTVFDEVLSCAG